MLPHKLWVRAGVLVQNTTWKSECYYCTPSQGPYQCLQHNADIQVKFSQHKKVRFYSSTNPFLLMPFTIPWPSKPAASYIPQFPTPSDINPSSPCHPLCSLAGRLNTGVRWWYYYDATHTPHTMESLLPRLATSPRTGVKYI